MVTRFCAPGTVTGLARIGAGKGDHKGRPYIYIALASTSRSTGFSTIGKLTSADITPNRIESHHTTS